MIILRNKRKINNNGITLIALVITIIVLLILAGVSIATLTGENGILTRASDAKEETGQATAKEKVEVEVLGSYDNNGNISIEKLNENLENVTGLTSELPIEFLPATVEVDGYTVIIRKDGSVVISEWIQTGYEITNGKITVKVGDYVLNYDELSNGAQSSKIEVTESGYTDPQNLTTEDLGWRILGIGENGGLELISDNPTSAKITLSGETGYLNAEEVLNTTCNELYGQGQYAAGARSLKVEDINKLANYNPKTYSGYGDLWKYRFSTETNSMQSSTSKDKGKNWSDWENIHVSGSVYQIFRMPGSTETISAENPKESEEIECTSYSYTISSNIIDVKIADMIAKGKEENYISQWLASCTVFCSSNAASFYVHRVRDGNINYCHLYNSYEYIESPSYTVRPVVTLKSNIQLEGNSEDGWTIK